MALNDFIPFECISIYLDKKKVHPEDPKASFIVFLVNVNTEIIKIFTVKNPKDNPLRPQEIVISWDFIKNAAINTEQKQNYVIIDFIITCEFQTCELYVKQEVLQKLEATLSLMLVRIQAKRYGRNEQEARESIRVLSTVEDSDFGAEEDLLKSASSSSGIIPSSFQTIADSVEVDETQNTPDANIIPASQPESEHNLEIVEIDETQFEVAQSPFEVTLNQTSDFGDVVVEYEDRIESVEPQTSDVVLESEIGTVEPQTSDFGEVVEETDYQDTQSDCSDNELNNYINKTLEKIANSQKNDKTPDKPKKSEVITQNVIVSDDKSDENNNGSQMVFEDAFTQVTQDQNSHFIELVDDLINSLESQVDSTPIKKPRNIRKRAQSFNDTSDTSKSPKKVNKRRKTSDVSDSNLQTNEKSQKTREVSASIKQKTNRNHETETRYLNKNIQIVKKPKKTRKRTKSFNDTFDLLTLKSPKKLTQRRQTSDVSASQLQKTNENVESDASSENEEPEFTKTDVSSSNRKFSGNENVRYLNKDYVKKTVDSEVSDNENRKCSSRKAKKSASNLKKINGNVSDVSEKDLIISKIFKRTVSASNKQDSVNENVQYLNKNIDLNPRVVIDVSENEELIFPQNREVSASNKQKTNEKVDTEGSENSDIPLDQRILKKKVKKSSKLQKTIESKVENEAPRILPKQLKKTASNKQKTNGKVESEVSENEDLTFLRKWNLNQQNIKRKRQLFDETLENEVVTVEKLPKKVVEKTKKTAVVSKRRKTNEYLESEKENEISENEAPKKGTEKSKKTASFVSKRRKTIDNLEFDGISENEAAKKVIETSNKSAKTASFVSKRRKTIDNLEFDEISKNEAVKKVTETSNKSKKTASLVSKRRKTNENREFDAISENEAAKKLIETSNKSAKTASFVSKRRKTNENLELDGISENEAAKKLIETSNKSAKTASFVSKRRKTIENLEFDQISVNEAVKKVTETSNKPKKTASLVSKRRKTNENLKFDQISENEAAKKVTETSNKSKKTASLVSKRRKTNKNLEFDGISENKAAKKLIETSNKSAKTPSLVSKRRKTNDNLEFDQISENEAAKKVTDTSNKPKKTVSLVSKRRKTIENLQFDGISENEAAKKVTETSNKPKKNASLVSKRRKTIENLEFDGISENEVTETSNKSLKTASLVSKRRKTSENDNYGQDFWDEVDKLRENPTSKPPKKVTKKKTNESNIISDFLKKVKESETVKQRQVLTDNESSSSKTPKNKRKRFADSDSDEWTPNGIKKYKKPRGDSVAQNDVEETDKNSFFSLYNRGTTLTTTRTRVVTRSNRYGDETNYFDRKSDSDTEEEFVKSHQPKKSVIVRQRSQSVSSVSSGSRTKKTPRRLSLTPKSVLINEPEPGKCSLPFAFVPNEDEFNKSFRNNLSQDAPAAGTSNLIQNEPPPETVVAGETSNLSEVQEIPPTFKPFPIFTSESSNYYNSSPDVSPPKKYKIPLKRKVLAEKPPLKKKKENLPPVILSGLPSPESFQSREINELNVQPLFQNIPGSQENDADLARREVKVQQLLDKVNQSLNKKMSEKQFYLLAIEVFNMCLKCIHHFKDLKHVLLYSFNKIYCNILQLAVVKSFL